jgi:hypothetical protein
MPAGAEVRTGGIASGLLDHSPLRSDAEGRLVGIANFLVACCTAVQGALDGGAQRRQSGKRETAVPRCTRRNVSIRSWLGKGEFGILHDSIPFHDNGLQPTRRNKHV